MKRYALLNRDFLHEQYIVRGRTLKSIADEIGCTATAVWRCLKRDGLPARPAGYQPGHPNFYTPPPKQPKPVIPRPRQVRHSPFEGVLTREFLSEHYTELGETTSQIAAEVGCPGSSVLLFLHRHGIPVRSARFKNGQVAPMKGRHGPSPSWKGQTKAANPIAARIAATLKGVPRPNRRGANHHAWKGGKTSEAMRIRNSPSYADWRRQIFERDGYRCQRCGGDGKLNVHHIQPFSTHPELRLEPSNGITLCLPCHRDRPHPPPRSRQGSPEYRQRISATLKAKWTDPAFREKQLAARGRNGR